MAAKFTVTKDKAGKYRFNLKAANGEIIAASESYPDKKFALKGIASVVKSAATAKIIDETGEEDTTKKAKAPAKKAAPKTAAKKPKNA